MFSIEWFEKLIPIVPIVYIAYVLQLCQIMWWSHSRTIWSGIWSIFFNIISLAPLIWVYVPWHLWLLCFQTHVRICENLKISTHFWKLISWDCDIEHFVVCKVQSKGLPNFGIFQNCQDIFQCVVWKNRHFYWGREIPILSTFYWQKNRWDTIRLQSSHQWWFGSDR